MNPILIVDSYKTEHYRQYPKGTTLVYSNLIPRSSRIEGVNSMVFFGLQYFLKKYLIEDFNKYFFSRPLEEVIEEYKFAIGIDTKHIEALHKLGYLPLVIKAVPEGTRVPMKVPCLTMYNTHPDFYWLTNYIETLLSAVLWQPCTSATIASEYKKLFVNALAKTVGDYSFADWMGHDFSARGMSSVESMITSGMGHLLSFTGTDTIPAIYALKNYYNAEGLIGASVPATEHSVMCAGSGVEGEFATFKRLITQTYPHGIISIVSDTFDLWKVLTEYLPALKSEVMARDGKLVIRPDSGDPVKIITGWTALDKLDIQKDKHGRPRNPISKPEEKGVIELLWDTFGGTIVNGYKVLDSHVGAIYGDSITIERAKQITDRLIAKGFAPILVYGIGSFTYQHNTRDTFGIAMKATYVEVDGKGIEIFKDPITDDGTKRSAKGLLAVHRSIPGRTVYKDNTIAIDDRLVLVDQCSKSGEQAGLLEIVFDRGVLMKETNLTEIRNRLL